MGIKGIYGEIGPGERIAFSKLAVESLERTGQPFRVAIDVSIWQFQTQSGQGGSNPAIRTFYYRLLRLLSISVQPVFIFDGPHKPPFKRGKKSGHHGASVPNMLTKQMLKLFGFPFYQAPGEAEAECALLQREGIVDAVLSEDVDTLMFGCGQTLRNWSSEGTRGNKAPTHVSVYNAKATKEGASGLDREGMVLVALMSGGDYITEGIPGCGIKVACQAARAGYGKSLCQLSRTDEAGLDAWRESLNHEIQTNESKYFRTKHNTLRIPNTFPDKEVLGYYTHPVVSSASKIQKLKTEIAWDGEVDVPGLRNFVADAFEWTNRIGAIKFIRGLAPVLLVHKLLLRRNRRASGYGDVVLTAMNEMDLVRSIAANRNHFSTDGLRELRLVFMPIDIVGLDLDAEYDDSADYGRDGLAPIGDDDQIEGYVSDDAAATVKRGPSQYDPTQPDKVWVSVTITRIGVPLKVEDYEESLKDPKKSKTKAAAKKATTKKSAMPRGALDRYMTTSKAGMASKLMPKDLSRNLSDDEDMLPPYFLAPMLEKAPLPRSGTERASRSSTRPSEASLPKSKTASISESRTKSKESNLSKLVTSTNPWTLATSTQTLPPFTKVTKALASTNTSKPTHPPVYELLSSSPIACLDSPEPSKEPQPQSKANGKVTTPTKRRHSASLSPPVSPSPQPRDLPTATGAYQRESLDSLTAHADLGLPDTVTISRHRSGRSRRHHREQNKKRSLTPSRVLVGVHSCDVEHRLVPLSDGDYEVGCDVDEIEDSGVATKINFGSSFGRVMDISSFATPNDSFAEDNGSLGIDHDLQADVEAGEDDTGLPELPELPPRESLTPPLPITQPNHVPTAITAAAGEKQPEIIDLSYSPPVARSRQPLCTTSHSQAPSRSQTQTQSKSKDRTKPTFQPSSKIQSFFNSSKSSQSQSKSLSQHSSSSVSVLSESRSRTNSNLSPNSSFYHNPSSTLPHNLDNQKENHNENETEGTKNSSRESKAKEKRGEEKKQGKKKKYIMLRESLAGAWKEMDEDEFAVVGRGDGGEKGAVEGETPGEKGHMAKRKGVWRLSQVEVLDLSGD